MLLVILRADIPNRRIQLEIILAQTYANNMIGNEYYSSAVVHILYVKLLYQGGYFLCKIMLEQFRTDK